MKRFVLMMAVGLCLLCPLAAEAQRLEVSGSLLAGTGLSVGMGAGTSLAQRNATAVAVQILAGNSELRWLRYGLTIRSEVEGKVTLGLVPQLMLLRFFGRFSLGGLIGLPLIIAPRSLYGVEVGGVVSFAFVEWAAVVGQLLFSFYPLGSDLPEGSNLTMIQLFVGVEFRF